jgi:hypothetical protein
VDWFSAAKWHCWHCHHSWHVVSICPSHQGCFHSLFTCLSCWHYW